MTALPIADIRRAMRQMLAFDPLRSVTTGRNWPDCDIGRCTRGRVITTPNAQLALTNFGRIVAV